MKKFIITSLLLALLTVLGGCQSTQKTTEDVVDSTNTQTEGQKTETEKQKSEIDLEEKSTQGADAQINDDEVYRKWAIESEYAMIEDTGKDCVSVANAGVYGGDLLSTLIVDGETRQKLSLDVYDKEYLKNLEARLAKYTQEKHQSDFYSFYVCRLGKDLDLVGGFFQPQGKATDRDSFSYNKFGENQHLLLAKNNEIIQYPENISLYNKTATGAEVTNCKAEYYPKTGNLLWTCFEGFERNDKKENIGENIHAWNLSLDGKVTNEFKEMIPL